MANGLSKNIYDMWFLSTTLNKRWDQRIKEGKFISYEDRISFMKKCQDLYQPEMLCNVAVIIRNLKKNIIKSTA